MRNILDYYKTPGFAVDSLLTHFPLDGVRIFDCCAGNGEISNILKDKGLTVRTNDIDIVKDVDYHFNACYPSKWPDEEMDFIVTNPPYDVAYDIITVAYLKAQIGIAMLLRLSFLEPTYERQSWLGAHPPNLLIVLPRISFTGDGKTDSVTVAWMIWHKLDKSQRIVITKKEK
jgi:hypothetical protein